MFGAHFQLNEQTIPIVEEIGRHMPGGFFIYKAAQPEELLYANRATFDIFGCRDLEEFKALTGYTFRGMLHPDDYRQIEESIEKQVAASEDNIDYVEYRIIRKDGSVRWVDNYGHYTETEAYGGIYYVFISDITEKRERMESDLAVRQAVIEALSESYHTMWIIDDVGSESFSLFRGDTEGSTIHAAPIREALGQTKYSLAKEHYIRTTVAPEDRERLLEELTLENIMAQLNERTQYSISYLRMMEGGGERYYRMGFARLRTPDGKLGVVCGFKDVDADIRQEREMEVDVAENGLFAVDLFTACEPGWYDAILMDMRMPVMDGLEATKVIRAIVIWSILLAGFAYGSMSVVSVAAVPDGYASRGAYFADLDSLGGIASVPTFYAARSVMGRAGLAIAVVSALASILTGIIGGCRATSRVLSAMAEDRILSEKFGSSFWSILFVMLLSILISFLGRNILNWFVDLTALGAIIGFMIETAVNGQEAVDMVAASEPGYYDAVLMDIQMPVMDGYTAARTIRSLDNRELASVPILAMTANAFKEDEQAADEAGMQAHIAKPIDVDSMLQKLTAVLSGAGKNAAHDNGQN